MRYTRKKEERRDVMKRVLMGGIRFYQKVISPMKPATCRFYPTCSHYGMEAIERHGAVKGSYLTTRRLLRCQPFHPGGLDFVPEPDQFSWKAPLQRENPREKAEETKE
ncbi:membrane protein insertion efficiency factor YidD [Exiguobacterium sp. A1_3_1]|jgi:putative membrane protein insertion efficiency factor|nr:membrane protein insertion efficiency factor YidD [Exiguobacterium sp. JMULE1]